MFIPPGGFENFLEQIDALSPATDMAMMIETTARYGNHVSPVSCISAIRVFTAVL
jgi:hypothetical protein